MVQKDKTKAAEDVKPNSKAPGARPRGMPRKADD
jgi:hypothetical protein